MFSCAWLALYSVSEHRRGEFSGHKHTQKCQKKIYCRIIRVVFLLHCVMRIRLHTTFSWFLFHKVFHAVPIAELWTRSNCCAWGCRCIHFQSQLFGEFDVCILAIRSPSHTNMIVSHCMPNRVRLWSESCLKNLYYLLAEVVNWINGFIAVHLTCLINRLQWHRPSIGGDEIIRVNAERWLITAIIMVNRRGLYVFIT